MLQSLTSNSLRAFDASDRARLAREAALNELEAFTYRSRDLLEDEGFVAASTKEQRAAIETQLHELSDWLYAEGVDADEKTLKAKHSALKALIDPVVARKAEAKNRPEAVAKLKELLGSSKDVMEMIRSSVDKVAAAESSAAAASASASSASAESSSSSSTPSASPSSANADDTLSDLEQDLPPPPPESTPQNTPEPFTSPYTADDLTYLTTKYDTIATWLETKLSAQAKLSPHDDPALTATELDRRHKELSDAIVDLAQRQLRANAKKTGGGKKSGSGSGAGSGGKKNKTTAAKRKEEKRKKAAEEEAAAEAAADGKKDKADEKKTEKETPEHGEL